MQASTAVSLHVRRLLRALCIKQLSYRLHWSISRCRCWLTCCRWASWGCRGVVGVIWGAPDHLPEGIAGLG